MAMREFKVTLLNGVETTMLLDEEDQKRNYPGAVPVGKPAAEEPAAEEPAAEESAAEEVKPKSRGRHAASKPADDK